MIISIYNSKGGVGKTSIGMLIASAIASYNSKEGVRPLKTLVIDTDPQGSMTSFFDKRADGNLESYGIHCESIDMKSEGKNRVKVASAREIFAQRESENDIVLIDGAGFFSNEAAELCFDADIVLVPTALSPAETDVSIPLVDSFCDLARKYKRGVIVKLLVNRAEPIETLSARALREIIASANIARMSVELPAAPAMQLMHGSGRYLHELMAMRGEKTGSSKSLEKLHTKAMLLVKEINEVIVKSQEGKDG